MPRRATGLLLAVVSATAFGVMPVLTKTVYEDGVGAPGVLSVRFTLAAVVLLLVGRLRGEAWPPRRARTGLVLLGGVGYATQAACYFLALERISAGLTALLLYLFPVMVVVLQAALLKTWPRRASTVCVLVATTGSLLTIGPVGAAQATGVLLGLGAAVSYALYIVGSSRVASGLGPFTSAGIVMAACAVVHDTVAVATGAALPQRASAWLALVAVALVGTVVAVSAFFAALERLGPADTSVVSTVEPLVSVLAAAAVLGERLGPVQAAGGMLVLGAVVALARLQPEAVPDEREVPV